MKKRLVSKIVNPLIVFTLLTFMAILMANQPAVQVLAEGNDTTAPVTEISFTSEDWQKEDIGLTLTCTDDVECDTTYYCIDTDNTCSPTIEYTATFAHTTEGTHYIRFYSVDTSLNEEEINSQILKLDKTLPSISITTPIKGQEISGTTFIIEGTSSDSVSGVERVEIEINGEISEAIGIENWQYQWEGFGDGTYTITAKAIDKASNEETSSAGVTVDNPPSGRIVSLDDPPLMKAGRIEVELQTSEPVQFTPTLSYSFTGEGSVQIPLDGSSQTWKGFMITSENDHDKIGTFQFSGTDFNGKTGNTLTQGSFFVVDSLKPNKVVSIGIDIDGDDVDLSWFYDGEDLKQFNIYRSKESNVGYVHYYKTVPSDTTKTRDDLDGKTYYYRVAAVDLAGNIGPLSDEVSATSGEEEEENTQETQTQSQTQTQTQPSLPGHIINKIDDLKEKIDSELSKIDKAKSNLEKDSVAEELGLILEINTAKATFTGFKGELDTLRKGTSVSDAEDKMQRINLKMLAILNDLPKEISLESEDNFIQEVSIKDIEEIVALIGKDLTLSERDTLISKNQKLQNRIEVRVTSSFFTVTLFEGEKEATLIKKEILSTLSNVSIVEVIPKTVASSLGEIHFTTQGYEVLKDDPVVKWNSNIDEIKYAVDKKVTRNDLRRLKTLAISEDSTSFGFFTGLTVFGRSSFSWASNAKMFIGLIILALLTIFYFGYLRNGDIKVYREKRKNYDPFKSSGDFRINSGRIGLRDPRQGRAPNFRNGNRNTRGRSIERLNEYANPLSSFQQTQLNNIPNEDGFAEHFQEAIEKASSYADAGNFTLTRKTYSLALELYKMLDPAIKRSSHSRILHVYNKLNLYSKIKELEVAERSNININLRNLLEHVFELHRVISKAERKDTNLLRFARNYYNDAITRFQR